MLLNKSPRAALHGEDDNEHGPSRKDHSEAGKGRKSFGKGGKGKGKGRNGKGNTTATDAGDPARKVPIGGTLADISDDEDWGLDWQSPCFAACCSLQAPPPAGIPLYHPYPACLETPTARNRAAAFAFEVGLVASLALNRGASCQKRPPPHPHQLLEDHGYSTVQQNIS